ncbi:uncharacterized protein LOC129225875 [Uloborus diversus]|uniref:uncharacterized protein LOC129225875 n=1 Tax=Uloborus diversus TaxID=327109 RepID=UPI00240A574D|nr:uncharacterized protein LOC129225875 [Uloborus diversus]
MWAVIVLLFLADKAFADGIKDVDCEQRAFRVCNPEMRRIDFPGSEDDLNAACPIFISRAECLNNYDEVCATKEEDSREFKPGQFKKVLDLLKDVCNNNSLLHKVLSENMGCIKESVENAGDVCTPQRSVLRKTYIAQRDIDYESESFDEMMKFQCLLTYNMLSCVTGEISRRCGDVTKSAVQEITFRSDILQSERCPPEHTSDMVDLVNDLELPAEQKQQILGYISSFNAWAAERE